MHRNLNLAIPTLCCWWTNVDWEFHLCSNRIRKSFGPRLVRLEKRTIMPQITQKACLATTATNSLQNRQADTLILHWLGKPGLMGNTKPSNFSSEKKNYRTFLVSMIQCDSPTKKMVGESPQCQNPKIPWQQKLPDLFVCTKQQKKVAERPTKNQQPKENMATIVHHFFD